MNELLREETPKDIRTRLKIEKLKDKKLDYVSIKGVV